MPQAPPRTRSPKRLLGSLCFIAAALLGCALTARSAANTIAAAPPGTVENGTPAFVVLAPETLGLSGPPTDLQFMPDGRVLVVSRHEVAFGDGMRWESFHGVDAEDSITSEVAIDTDGKIYTAIRGGVAQLEFGAGSIWRTKTAATFPAAVAGRSQPRVKVQAEWLWHGDGNFLLSWRPGQEPRIAGRIGAIEGVYHLGNDILLADQSLGGVFRLGTTYKDEPVRVADTALGDSVTCGTPFGPDQLLLGTVSGGLKLFDGRTFQSFGPAGGLLQSRRRITDVCTIGTDFFAAAVDTVGIVFFDREGRIVQVLGRSLDHRLARVEGLRYAANGVLWALLNEGVARVEFPSPLSDFSLLLAGGLGYAQPQRHEGVLWIQTDGQAMRAVYDDNGRLESFVNDTPPGGYLFTLAEYDGQLFAGNLDGLLLYRDHAWQMICPGLSNPRIGVGRSGDNRIYYVARGEYGFIERVGDEYRPHRIPYPSLGDSYNTSTDAAGVGWLELGMSRVGRLDPRAPTPELKILGADDGIGKGWAEIYVLNGIARIHVSRRLYRFDESSHRFVEDQDLLTRYPQLAAGGGRPVTDGLSRLWYTNDLTPQAIDLSPEGGGRRIELPTINLTPIGYSADADGVVWLFQKGRLMRLDLRIPRAPPVRLRALITSVEFSASNRQLFEPGAALAPLAYRDNSLTLHFAAPANPFSSPITFEVMLEGAGAAWASTGGVGTATFNHLKEGRYVFRVRPVAKGGRLGEEARLAFQVLPPWYRTNLAWGLYIFSAIALVAAAAWLSSFLQRRENERLEHLVSARTRELERQIAATSEKTAALAASEERYRTLNAELEQRVADRTAELSLSNVELQQRESLFRLVFENAPVGISWKRADLDNVFHFNPTFLRILGLPPDTPFDREKLFALVHPDDAPRQRELSHLIEAGEIDSYNLEERFCLADGRLVWAALSIAVIRDPAGNIIQHIGILEDITQRKSAEQELAETYKNLVATSRVAGMAEVATGVLHNVGNVLNSVNVSANLLGEAVQQSRTELLVKLSRLLDEHAADLGEFLTRDPKGRRVPELLRMLADHAVSHRDSLAAEIAGMQKNVDHIKDIVVMQQSYATTAGVVEVIAAATLFEDALRMNESSLARHEIRIVRDFAPVPTLSVEKGKVLQILTNLIRNAKFACEESALPPGERSITLRIEPGAPGRIRFLVIDNGVGIAPENLSRIFSHGFTTRAHGHGFGLHASVLAAREMHGSLVACSDGPGQGATFTLELPAAVPRSPDQGNAPAEFPEVSAGRASVTRRLAPAAVG